jgi:signal transduction histidine kinase
MDEDLSRLGLIVNPSIHPKIRFKVANNPLVSSQQLSNQTSIKSKSMERPEAEKIAFENEVARLEQLYQYQVVDMPLDSSLDDLIALAAGICKTPIAVMSLVDGDRQWFKAQVGISVSEIPYYIGFGINTIEGSTVCIIPDTWLDDRLCHHPFVIGSPYIRFYTSVPLITETGFFLGVLSLFDFVPRDLSDEQLASLQTLSRQVMVQLALKKDAAKLRRIEQDFYRLQSQFIEQRFLKHQESILFNLASQIRHSLDLDTILATAVQEILRCLEVDRCQFMWCLPSGQQKILTVTHEAKLPALPSFSQDFPLQQDATLAAAIVNLEVLKIDHVSTAPNLPAATQEKMLTLGIRSQLLLPLKTYSGHFGAIVCSYEIEQHDWADSEVRLLQAITNQLAIALDQAELFAQTRSTALAAQTQAKQLTKALEKLQQTPQLVQHEKMAGLSQLVAGIAHEINNPVTFISGNINHLSHYVEDLIELLTLYQIHYPEPVEVIQEKIHSLDLEFLTEDAGKLLTSMRMGVKRIDQVVLSLRNFSRLDEMGLKRVDIHEGIDNTLLIVQSRLKENKVGSAIQVVKNYGDLPTVECHAGQLNQVFLNILSNAIDALDERIEDPTITICSEVVTAPSSDLYHTPNPNPNPNPNPHIRIRIHDNGSGMTDKVKQNLFNPFFTTKPIGKGTGLGLSISYQIIVEKHKGTLKYQSYLGQGSEFLIQIPIEQNQ